MLKAQKNAIQELEAKIERVILKEHLDEANQRTAKIGKDLETLTIKVSREYSTLEVMNEKVTQLDKFMRDNFIMKTLFHKYHDIHGKTITKMSHSIDELEGYAKRLDREIIDVKSNTVSKKDIRAVRQEITGLCKYDDLKDLYNKV